MMKSDLFDQILATVPADREVLELLRYEFNERVYSFGNHFKNPAEGRRSSPRWRNLASRLAKRTRPANQTLAREQLVCGAYGNLSSRLADAGFPVTPLPWHAPALRSPLQATLTRVSRQLRSTTLVQDILSGDFTGELRRLSVELRNYFEGATGLIVAYDLPFLEQLSLQICRELGVPTAVMLHGLPGRYNSIDDNRADFLCVWGQAIADHYVRAGVPKSKVRVVGTTRYHEYPEKMVKPTGDDILIIAKTPAGGQPSSDLRVVSDRAQTIVYVLEVAAALAGRTTGRFRVRPHPSENPDWYRAFLDPKVFEIDALPLDQSLAQATAVVGPTSTVLLDTLMAGKPYLVYEPNDGGLDRMGWPIVGPFDGSHPDLPVAREGNELVEIFELHAGSGLNLLRDYVQLPLATTELAELFPKQARQK